MNLSDDFEEIQVQMKKEKVDSVEEKTELGEDTSEKGRPVYQVSKDGASKYGALLDNDEYPKKKPVKTKKKGNGILVGSIIVFLLALTLFGVTVIKYLSDKKEKAEEEEAVLEVTYTQAEVDSMISEAVTKAQNETAEYVKEDYLQTLHEATSTESGTWNLLREYFPDQVVFTEGNRFTYIDVDKNLQLNTLDNNFFLTDEITGYRYYTDAEGNKTSYMGIDVSTFQGEIDWKTVKESGIDFAIIRCGIRGYGTAKLVEDSRFADNIKGASEAGVQVGVYFFTQAINKEEAVEEAEFVLSLLEEYDVKGPVVIDTEFVDNEARADKLSVDEMTDVVVAFCDRIAQAGREPMIYTGLKYYIRRLDMSRLEPYAKWFAYYNTPLYFPYKLDMWQYSKSGRVPGISTEVDLDILFEKWW